MRQHWTDPAAIEAEIARIRSLPLDALRRRWRVMFGRTPPAALSKDLLGRMMACRLQEQAFGSLDRESLRFLDGLARHGGAPRRQLKPGTVLVRDYHGQRHTVTVAPDGFNWQGTTYPSLSAIARAITGTAWSGAAGCGGSTADPSRRRKCSEQLFDNRITPFRCRFLARAYRGPILSISRGDTMSPNGSFATAPRCPAVLSGIHMLAGGDWTAWLGM